MSTTATHNTASTASTPNTSPEEEPPPLALVELDIAAPAAWPVPEMRLQATVEQAVRAALAEAAADGAQVSRDGVPPLIEVLLTDDEAIRALNAQWRGKDSPTNVLSFPAPADMPLVAEAPWPLGSLALAGGVMAREAAGRGVDLAEHLSWMVIHGILHLLGYDHENDTEAMHMEALERAALARLGLPDPRAQA